MPKLSENTVSPKALTDYTNRIDPARSYTTPHNQGARLLVFLFLVGLSAAGATNPLFAQVQLPTVNLGVTNFEDGFASPGWFLEEFLEGYIAGELKDSNGQTAPGFNRVITYSTTTHVAFISDKRFLGGWWTNELLLPVADLDVQLANGTHSRVRGLGDLTVGSGLQWAPKKLGKGVLLQRVMVNVGVPTGPYSDVRPINTGNHFVVLNPHYAFTYEPARQLEFSARAHYLWNSTNHDPFVGLGVRNVQPGQALHVNYSISYKVFRDVRLGFNGYWLQQITDHQIDGTSLANSKEHTVGLGPGVQLGDKGIWFRVNGYFETDVRNRPSGVAVTFRISKALAAPPVP